MNINVMQKDAKTLGLYREFKQELDYRVNPLYCWDVAWRQSNKDGDYDTIVICNQATGFCAFVAGVTSLEGLDLKKTVKDAFNNCFKLLNLDQKYIDAYFKAAGEFKYGLIRDSRVTSRLSARAKKALSAYGDLGLRDENGKRSFWGPCNIRPLAEEEKDEVSRTLALYVNNSKDHPYYMDYKGSPDRIELMRNTLLEGDFPDLLVSMPSRRVYEFLVTLDLDEDYKAIRRIVVPDDMSFDEFRRTIMAAYDWDKDWESVFRFTGLKPNAKDGLYEDMELVPPGYDSFYRVSDHLYTREEQQLKDLVEDYEELLFIYDYYQCEWEHQVELVAVHEDYTDETPFLIEASKEKPSVAVENKEDFQQFNKARKYMDTQGDWRDLYYEDWGRYLYRHPWSPRLRASLRPPKKLDPDKYIKKKSKYYDY